MDWRERIKTQPYLFHLEVPHIKAGETAAMGGRRRGKAQGCRAAAPAGATKNVAIEAAEFGRKYRESLGIVARRHGRGSHRTSLLQGERGRERRIRGVECFTRSPHVCRSCEDGSHRFVPEGTHHSACLVR